MGQGLSYCVGSASTATKSRFVVEAFRCCGKTKQYCLAGRERSEGTCLLHCRRIPRLQSPGDRYPVCLICLLLRRELRSKWSRGISDKCCGQCKRGWCELVLILALNARPISPCLCLYLGVPIGPLAHLCKVLGEPPCEQCCPACSVSEHTLHELLPFHQGEPGVGSWAVSPVSSSWSNEGLDNNSLSCNLCRGA